jgi:hypothetical protein
MKYLNANGSTSVAANGRPTGARSTHDWFAKHGLGGEIPFVTITPLGMYCLASLWNLKALLLWVYVNQSLLTSDQYTAWQASLAKWSNVDSGKFYWGEYYNIVYRGQTSTKMTPAEFNAFIAAH